MVEGIFFCISAFSFSNAAFFFFSFTHRCFAAASGHGYFFELLDLLTVRLNSPCERFFRLDVSKSTRTRLRPSCRHSVAGERLNLSLQLRFLSCISASSCKAAAVWLCTASDSWIAPGTLGSSMCRRFAAKRDNFQNSSAGDFRQHFLFSIHPSLPLSLFLANACKSPAA
jgi:hypothetical protein